MSGRGSQGAGTGREKEENLCSLVFMFTKSVDFSFGIGDIWLETKTSKKFHALDERCFYREVAMKASICFCDINMTVPAS